MSPAAQVIALVALGLTHGEAYTGACCAGVDKSKAVRALFVEYDADAELEKVNLLEGLYKDDQYKCRRHKGAKAVKDMGQDSKEACTNLRTIVMRAECAVHSMVDYAYRAYIQESLVDLPKKDLAHSILDRVATRLWTKGTISDRDDLKEFITETVSSQMASATPMKAHFLEHYDEWIAHCQKGVPKTVYGHCCTHVTGADLLVAYDKNADMELNTLLDQTTRVSEFECKSVKGAKPVKGVGPGKTAECKEQQKEATLTACVVDAMVGYAYSVYTFESFIDLPKEELANKILGVTATELWKKGPFNEADHSRKEFITYAASSAMATLTPLQPSFKEKYDGWFEHCKKHGRKPLCKRYAKRLVHRLRALLRGRTL